MPRKGRIDIVGKLERIEQEQLADELPELLRAVRGEWREQCRQRAGATAQLDCSPTRQRMRSTGPRDSSEAMRVTKGVPDTPSTACERKCPRMSPKRATQNDKPEVRELARLLRKAAPLANLVNSDEFSDEDRSLFTQPWTEYEKPPGGRRARRFVSAARGVRQ